MISLVPAAEPKSFICKFRKIESFSESSTITSVFNNHLRGQMSFDAAVSDHTGGGGIAEQRIS